MPHKTPSKETMIAAVRKSGCTNLTHLPLEVMTAEQIYSHLLAARCPCLQKLLGHKQYAESSGKSRRADSSESDDE